MFNESAISHEKPIDQNDSPSKIDGFNGTSPSHHGFQYYRCLLTWGSLWYFQHSYGHGPLINGDFLVRYPGLPEGTPSSYRTGQLRLADLQIGQARVCFFFLFQG